MSYFSNNALSPIKKALSDIEFDRVSNLSKSEFEEVLAKVLTSVINSRDFEQRIKEIVK